MKKYIFCSLRGNDFTVEGNTPQEAWDNLCEQEKDEGTLWRCFDTYCNKYAVEHNGFTPLFPNDPASPVYKEK